MDPVVTAQSLGRRFGHRWAVARLNLEVGRNERLLIIGPNGRTTSGLMPYGPDGWVVDRVGKAAAGRHLDGVTHDAFPETKHG